MNRYDPLGYDLPLPLEKVFHPFGYPLLVSTNSVEVMAAAEFLWGRYKADFPGAALRFRIFVSGEGMPRPAMHKGVGNLILTCHDTANHAVCDLADEAASAWITADVARNRVYLSEHFLEPFSCYLVSARRAVIVHAACVALDGNALLLCGDSGAGKTSISWGCARKGWTFLSGDAMQLSRHTDALVVTGRPFSIRFRAASRELFPELQDYPAVTGPRGKLDIEADPQVLGAASAQSAVATGVVMLERSPEPGATLTPVTSDEVYRYLTQTIFYGPEEMREQHRAHIRDFAQLPAFRLRYCDPDAAEQVLRQLAGKGSGC